VQYADKPPPAMGLYGQLVVALGDDVLITGTDFSYTVDR
jgi:hypothetical protein